ncbi:MAG: ATPase [Sphingomonadales bacterium]|nr:MAG: ATPase [Sphingomonadales bacterium]
MSRTDRASRLIAAPPAKVYAAFVDAAALVRWLPPEGMTGEILDFDARPGGGYSMALTYDTPDPDVAGKSSEHGDRVAARFVELVPGKRIVQRAEFDSEDPAFSGTMTLTWSLDAADGSTRVEIVCRDVPAGIGRHDHIAGLKSSLRNLARFVEG